MAAAPPLTITVLDGAVGRATIQCATSAAGTLHSLALTVSRSWVDLLIGSTSAAGDLTETALGGTRVRLAPGDHIISFTPTGAAFYITGERNREGITAITNMHFTGPGDFVLPTPFEEDDLLSLRSAQSRDVRWFFHSRHHQRVLVRYANTSWGLAYWQVEDGPFLGFGDGLTTLTPAAVRGTDITITASADVFFDDHVGALFQLTHAGQREAANITAEDDFTAAIRVSGVEDGRIFTAVVAGTFVATVTLQRSVGNDTDWQDVATYAVGSHQIDDGFDNSIIYYRIGVKAGGYTSGTAELELVYASGETTGVARIVSVVDGDEVTVDILAPFGAITATRTWQEGAWSTLRGWPSAGDLFDGRLWLGSVLTVFASVPDAFTNYAIGAEDSYAINRQMAIGDASPIRWIKGAFRLQVGTDAGSADIDAVRLGEAQSLQIRSSSFDEPITPTNMTMREVSAKIVFVDSSGNRLLRLTYDLDTNSFVADDLNRLHEEVGFLGGGFVDLAYQARPRPRLWAVRADGQLACLTLAEQEQVVGWSRLLFGAYTLYAEDLAADDEDSVEPDLDYPAAVESVCATPGLSSTADTDQDFLHMIVCRVLNGQAVRCHERLERERVLNSDDACFLESAVLYEGAAARYISGLDHLIGETVIGWGEGAQWGPYEVVDLSTLDDSFVDGEIGVDLGEDNELTQIWLGLEMRTRYLSGKLPYGAQAGTAVGEPKKVDHVTMLFHKTAIGGVWVGILDGNEDDPFAAADDDNKAGQLFQVADLAENFNVDDPLALFSGELALTLMSETMTDPRLGVEIRGAGPAAILGYVVNMTTQESG